MFGRRDERCEPRADEFAGAVPAPPTERLDGLFPHAARGVGQRCGESLDGGLREWIFDDPERERGGGADRPGRVAGERQHQRVHGFGTADASEGQHRPAPHLGIRIGDPVGEPAVAERTGVFEFEHPRQPFRGRKRRRLRARRPLRDREGRGRERADDQRRNAVAPIRRARRP